MARRLTAILAADVVSFSRMMEADEAGTLALLKSTRREVFDPAVRERGGRIVKTTGDGFSALDPVAFAIERLDFMPDPLAGEGLAILRQERPPEL